MNEENDDILGGEAPAPKKKKAAKKAVDPKKPSKAKVTKPAKEEAAPKKTSKKAAPAAKGKKAKGGDEDAPKRGRPKVRDDDVSTQQPEDGVVLKAVRKLKEATLAAEFAAGLGVHRRVIRAQLQRLSKDKANGVKMEKDGYNWFVTNRQKAV